MTAEGDIADELSSLEESTLRALESAVTSELASLDRQPLSAAAKRLANAVSKSLLDSLSGVRDKSAKSLSYVTGHDVARSSADDSARGDKASAYYVDAWLAAMPSTYAKAEGGSSGGGGATDDWDSDVAYAGDAAASRLADIAAYEVPLAWNDESRRGAETLPVDGISYRWCAILDKHLCARCKPLDGTVVRSVDGFKDGWPPLHGRCRCFIVTQVDLPSRGFTMPHSYESHHGVANNTIVAKALHVKRIDSVKRTADFVASTSDIDRAGDVLEQDWDLEAFMANPVCLFAHDSDDLPIGKAVDVGVRNGQLECTIQFSTAELNPLAEQVWRNVQEGVLRAVSVGFMPGEVRWEMRDGIDVYVYSRNKLFEISVVPIPCNQHALAKMKSKALDAARHAGRRIDNPEQGAPHNTSFADNANTEPSEMTEELNKDLDAESVEVKAIGEKAASLEARAIDAEAKLAALVSEKSAFEAQTKALADARDAAEARALAAESKLVDLEVEALVGSVISPAEKSLFVDLRKSNADLFYKMVGQRKPLALDVPVIAGNDEDQGVAKTLSGDAGAEFLAKVKALG